MLQVQRNLIKIIEKRATNLQEWEELNARMVVYFQQRASYSPENVERLEREETAAQNYLRHYNEYNH